MGSSLMAPMLTGLSDLELLHDADARRTSETCESPHERISWIPAWVTPHLEDTAKEVSVPEPPWAVRVVIEAWLCQCCFQATVCGGKTKHW